MPHPANERRPCPRCNSNLWMVFLFPASRPDPEVDKEIGRFQRCRTCGWTGDAVTGNQFVFGREGRAIVVNDAHFESPEAFCTWWVGVHGSSQERTS